MLKNIQSVLLGLLDMIRFVKGNLLESSAQALVNTVNTVGVMGKGIASQFKEAYPNNYIVYKKACKDKLIRGRFYVLNSRTKCIWNS